MKVEINNTVRVKECKKAKKIFNRNYKGNPNIVAELKEKGLKAGENVLSFSKFQKILKKIPTTSEIEVENILREIKLKEEEGKIGSFKISYFPISLKRKVQAELKKQSPELFENFKIRFKKKRKKDGVKKISVFLEKKETKESQEEVFDDFF
jgi:hypothetical protein